MPAKRKPDSYEQFSAEDHLVTGVKTASGNSGGSTGWAQSESIRAQLDVNAVTGSSPTLDVTIEDSVDNTNWNTVGTFTQKNAAAQQVINIAEPFADRIRVKWVIAGTTAANASLSTNLTGANNDIVYTAVSAVKAEGEAVTVAYIDPSENDAELGVVVTDSDIVVNLATDGTGTITSTADDIKAAIEADEDASALVTVADKAANDGSGVVIALVETALSGGVDEASFNFDVTLETELDT